MNNQETKFEIENFGACEDAVEYRSKYKTFKEAWENCHRGDWMLWIAKRIGVDKRILTLAKAKCAETVIHLMTDERSKNAIKVAIAYGNWNATDAELRKAYAYAAGAAAADAAGAAAAAAADAAYAACAAAYAAYAAADDDDDDDAAYARRLNQAETAAICRDTLTNEVFKILNLTE